ncbi:MAG: PmoA family protein [Armatimonadota bacterium]
MDRRELLTTMGLAALAARGGAAEVPLPNAKPVPRMQALPQPLHQASLERDGRELTRYYFSPELRRPYLYPILGPSGRSLTRMGHPHASVSHLHHNSFWVSHNDVNGDVFWADDGPGRIVHQYISKYSDGDRDASIVAINHWVGKDDRVHIVERRGMRAVDLENGEWLLVLDLQLETEREPAVLGKTPFGMAAVRMAKTIGVLDGGGTIRNSEGNVDEQGPNGVFWKRARWVDYSGPILPGVNEGLTLFDHPSNANHPSHFHVRGDGWMGASLTFDAPRTIEPGKPLWLRYGLYVHRGVPALAEIDRQWSAFSRTRPEQLPNERL